MPDAVRPQVVPSGILTSSSSQVQRAAIVAALRERPMSRSEIARHLQLSLSVVSRLTHGLHADGWLIEGETHQVPIGRPRRILRINPSIGHLVTVLLGPSGMRVRLVDAAGNPIGTMERPLTQPVRPTDICAALEALIAEHDVMSPTLVVGISAPGVVYTDGSVCAAPDLGWDCKVDLVRPLRERFGCTVTVENDVNLMMFAERVAGVATDVPLAAFLYHGMGGIGLGVMADGMIVHGANGAYGEVGLIPLDMRDPAPATATFEGSYSMAAIGARLEKMGITPMPSPIRALLDAAQDGKDEGLLDEMLLVVARAIEIVILLLNPDLIVIGGGLRQALGSDASAITKRLSARIPFVPRIEISRLGETELQLAIQSRCWDDLLMRGPFTSHQ